MNVKGDFFGCSMRLVAGTGRGVCWGGYNSGCAMIMLWPHDIDIAYIYQSHYSFDFLFPGVTFWRTHLISKLVITLLGSHSHHG